MERKSGNGAARGTSARTGGGAGGLPYLFELEPEIRAAAILDDEGNVVECLVPTGGEDGETDRHGFGSAALKLVTAVDEAGGKAFDHCHVASPEAEFFVVREGGFSLVALTERFVLASLMAFDMRMTLRDLSKEPDVA